MQPFLRWAGSKRKLLAVLEEYWTDPAARYIEPFAGSAALYFHLEPSSAILSDLNHELIGTFRALKRDPHLVIQCLRRLPSGKEEYYRIRSIDAKNLALSELAARFIYLNHYCFNGLFRTNALLQFNVPFGPPKSGAPINTERIIAASRLLKQSSVVHCDFEKTLLQAGDGDFAFVDPPYFIEDRKVFNEYLPGSFVQKDLERLADVIRTISARGCRFVLCYQDTPLVRDMFSSWNLREVMIRRNIAGFSGNRRLAREIVISNIEPQQCFTE